MAATPPKAPTAWSVGDVSLWLRDVELEELVAVFETNRINGRALLSLTEPDLQIIGVTAFGHKKALLSAIKELQQQQQQKQQQQTPTAPSPSADVAAVATQSSSSAGQALFGRMGFEQQQNLSGTVIPLELFPPGYKPTSNVHDSVARAMGEALWPAGFSVMLRDIVNSHVATTQRVREAMAQHKLTDEEARAVVYYTSDARQLPGGCSQMSVYRELNMALAQRQQTKIKAWSDFTVVLVSAMHKLPRFEGEVYRAMDKPLTQLSKQYRAGNNVCWVAFTSCSKSRKCLEEFAGSVSSGTWISLKVRNARDISELSLFPEEEVLLMPNTVLRVE